MNETSDTMSVRTIDLHGRAFAYRQAGAGPLVVLVHGLAGTMGTWNAVVDGLATSCTVIAVDLPGHGFLSRCRVTRRSARRGTRFVTCWTSWDTGRRPSSGILWEEVSRCSSLAYQYPQRCDRLVLVSSGGLGAEVSAILRAAALPGADHLLAIVAHRHLIAAGKSIGRLAATVGVRPTPGLLESARGYATLADGESRDLVHPTVSTST